MGHLDAFLHMFGGCSLAHVSLKRSVGVVYVLFVGNHPSGFANIFEVDHYS